MNKNIRKFFFAAIMLTALAPTFSAHAGDVTVPSGSYAASGTIQPRSSVIVYKFRIKNGVRQYRRWNETKGCWVDPVWIPLT